MGIGTVGAIVHGSSLPLFLRFFAILVNSFGSDAHNVDKMTREVLKYAFYFLVVGVAIWASSWAKISCWMWTIFAQIKIENNSEVTTELTRMEGKIQATSDIAYLRRPAMLHTASLCEYVESFLDGAADPATEQWGKTTEEEKLESGIGGWPGVSTEIKPPNSTLRLYGGAAFERVIHEFCMATYSVECPVVSREKVFTGSGFSFPPLPP